MSNLQARYRDAFGNELPDIKIVNDPLRVVVSLPKSRLLAQDFQGRVELFRGAGDQTTPTELIDAISFSLRTVRSIEVFPRFFQFRAGKETKSEAVAKVIVLFRDGTDTDLVHIDCVVGGRAADVQIVDRRQGRVVATLTTSQGAFTSGQTVSLVRWKSQAMA